MARCGVGLLLAALVLATVADAGRDFYKILGVQRNSNTKTIKKAYRKLAAKYHPDKNPGDRDAESKFSDVGAAYETLTNADHKALYDREGEEGLKKKGQGGGGDPFSSMFGGMFGQQQGGGEQEIPKGGDIMMDLDVTLEQLFIGDVIELMRAKSVPKQTSGTRECNCRNEMKTVQVGQGQFQMQQQKVCEQCPNVKLVTEYSELDVDVEIGMKQGQEIPYHGEGEPHIDGEPGSLVLRVNVLKHPVFTRRKNHLLCNATITLKQSLLGFTIILPHLDGHKVEITRDKITAPGTTLLIKGEGMRSYENNNKAGDLFVTFRVEFPDGKMSAADIQSLGSILPGGDKTVVFNGLEARFVPSERLSSM